MTSSVALLRTKLPAIAKLVIELPVPAMSSSPLCKARLPARVRTPLPRSPGAQMPAGADRDAAEIARAAQGAAGEADGRIGQPPNNEYPTAKIVRAAAAWSKAARFAVLLVALRRRKP